MNEIHMRFVKAGEITGYGKYEAVNGWVFDTLWLPNGELIRSMIADLIERGIKVRGTVIKDAEVWYHNDTFLVDGKDAVLEYREDIHEWVFRCTKIRDSYRFADAVGSGCEIVRIGNIHEGEKP